MKCMKCKGRILTVSIYVLTVIFLWGGISPSYGQEVVKVGVIYPLTGALETTGRELKHAVELATDICNNKYPELAPLLMAETEGVKIKRGGKLVNAKIALEWGNSEGNVVTGAAEVSRLVRDKGVVGILGCWQSAVTRAAATAAAREEVPLLTQSVALDLTKYEVMGESLKWFFRPNPAAIDLIEVMFKFMDAIQEKKKDKIKNIAIFHENTLYGKDNAMTAISLIQEKYKHYNLVATVPYAGKTSDVVAEVLTLKKANPDVVYNVGPYISDAILFTKTFKEQGFGVKGFLWDDAGTVDPTYLKSVGKEAEGYFTRMIYNVDLRAKKPLIGKIDDLFKKRYGSNMDDNSARAMLKALVLFDAINRAQSDKPDDIRKALLAADIPESKTNMIFGVKFDPTTHQNIRTAGLALVGQARGGQWRIVYPWDFASVDVLWPTPK